MARGLWEMRSEKRVGSPSHSQESARILLIMALGEGELTGFKQQSDMI